MIPHRTTALLATAALTMGAVAFGVGPAVASGPATGDSITVDLSTPGTVSSATAAAGRLPGWKLPTGTSSDGEVTASQQFRVSNSKLFFSHGGFVTPRLTVAAGETGVGAVNTFDASFTLASSTGAYQPGLGIGVTFDDGSWGRTGGVLIATHQNNLLKIGTFHPEAALNTGTRPVASNTIVWTEHYFAELDPTGTYDLRAVVRFVDGDSNDVIDFYVDNELVYTGKTWEGYNEIKNSARVASSALGFFAGTQTTSVQGLPITSAIVATPGLAGAGALFSDIRYSSYQIDPIPVVVPDVTDDVVSETPDGNLALDDTAPAEQTTTLEAFGSGFDPFENVKFTWHSTPIFAGWAQADAFGDVRATFTIPDTLRTGTVHTLQAIGERSGRVVNAEALIAAPTVIDEEEEEGAAAQITVHPPTGSALDPTLIGLAGALLIAGLTATVAVWVRTRRANGDLN